MPQSPAEKVNDKLLAFLGFWDRGMWFLLLIGVACAVASTALRLHFLSGFVPGPSVRLLIAVLFECTRFGLLTAASVLNFAPVDWPSDIKKITIYCTCMLFLTSIMMNITPHFQFVFEADVVAHLKSGRFLVVLLIVLLDFCLFATLTLPFALNGILLRSVFSHRRAEEEAVVKYIWELRAQRIREGKVDIAKHTILQRLAEIFFRAKSDLK